MPAIPLRPDRLRSRERWAAAAIALVGAFTSLWRLGTPQVLPDELVYVPAGAALLAGQGDPNLEHPPLAKFLFGIAQELAVEGVWAGRLVAAAASIAIGVLLFVLVRRMAGNRAGLLAAGLWAALPHAGGSSGPLAEAGRLDRFAMLDPIATALAFGAVVAGFSWLQKPRWQAAALTGLLGGLAGGAKPTGALVLPAVAVVVLWVRRDRWPRPAAGVAVAVLTSLAGLALAYAPLGADGLEGLRTLVAFQSQHAADGHVVTVAGTTSAFPPWWSHLWFHVRDDGAVLTAILLAGLPAAIVVARRDAPASPRRLGVSLLAAAFLVVFIALAASPVKLPFYRYAWWPLLVALLAIALDAAEQHRRERGRADAVWFAAVLVVVALVATSLPFLASVARLQPGGYEQVRDRIASTSGFVHADYQPLLVRGRPAILAHYVQQWSPAPFERTDDLDEAVAVLLDPGITSRFPRPEVDGVLDDPAWQCEPFEELTLCLRSPS